MRLSIRKGIDRLMCIQTPEMEMKREAPDQGEESHEDESHSDSGSAAVQSRKAANKQQDSSSDSDSSESDFEVSKSVSNRC